MLVAVACLGAHMPLPSLQLFESLEAPPLQRSKFAVVRGGGFIPHEIGKLLSVRCMMLKHLREHRIGALSAVPAGQGSAARGVCCETCFDCGLRASQHVQASFWLLSCGLLLPRVCCAAFYILCESWGVVGLWQCTDYTARAMLGCRAAS